jgi:hypothetical protein
MLDGTISRFEIRGTELVQLGEGVSDDYPVAYVNRWYDPPHV